VGNASIVPTLAAAAAGEDQAEQAAARSSLARLKGDDVDRALVAAIKSSAEPKVRLELIRAAGDRGATAAAPTLLQMAHDPNPEVRRESLRALRGSASGSDIPNLLSLVLKPAQRSDRAEAVRSLTTVLRRSDSSHFSSVLSSFASAGDTESRTALMQVMGQSGNHTALLLLRGSLKEEDANLTRAAILALTDWPDSTPIPDLLETAAASSSSPAHQVLALRGVLRLISSSAQARPPRESVKLLASVMSLAKQADEKRAVLALLPRFPTPEALELARDSLNDSQVAAESKEAVDRLERRGRR
jgi:HEAT repeat protein